MAALMASTGPSFGCRALLASTGPEVPAVAAGPPWWGLHRPEPRLSGPGGLYRLQVSAVAAAGLRVTLYRPELRLPGRGLHQVRGSPL